MKLAEFLDFADSVMFSKIHINKATSTAIVESAESFTCGVMLFDSVVCDTDSLLLITSSVYPVGISNCKCNTNGANVTDAYLRPLYGVVFADANAIPAKCEKGDRWSIIDGAVCKEYIGTGTQQYKSITYA